MGGFKLKGFKNEGKIEGKKIGCMPPPSCHGGGFG
jgi:hypothetical protein